MKLPPRSSLEPRRILCGKRDGVELRPSSRGTSAQAQDVSMTND